MASTTLLVKDAERQVEAAQHLDQPLVQQALRHHDQYALRAFGQQLLMQDQAGLDGLAQTHLVGQQHPRCMAIRHLVGNVELVRNQTGAPAGEAAQFGMCQPVEVLQCLVTQLKPPVLVNLSGEQAFCRPIQLQVAVELAFGQIDTVAGFVAAAVGQQAVLFPDMRNRE